MDGLLLHRPAWYVLGPLIGLVVLGLLLAINERFGVLGGYSNVVERVTRRSPVLGWKGWLLVGVLGGSLVFRLVAGSGAIPDGYGWLTRTFSGTGGDVAVGGLLLVAGGVVGFRAENGGGGRVDRLRREDGRRLHVGQRARRLLGGVDVELRRDGDVHGRGDRGHVPPEGGDPRCACDGPPACSERRSGS